MKKTSLVNLIIIIGLLVLGIMTLLAVYATVPESSTVLLFEENFNALDETKWEQHTADCKEDGDTFLYYKTGQIDGYTEDGVLYIKPNLTEETRAIRDATPKCYSCINSENSDSGCVSSLYSAKLQTKNVFEANSGRIEVRAKLPTGNWIRSFIGITDGQNNTDEEPGGFNIIKTVEGESKNGSAELTIFLGSAANQTILKSSITVDEFHVFEIEWNNDTISFKIDQQQIGKQEFEGSVEGKTDSTARRAFKSKRAVNQPFYLNVGVDVGEKNSESMEEKKSVGDSMNQKENESSSEALQVDYIRIFKT